MSFLMKKRVWIHQGRRFTTRSHRQTVFTTTRTVRSALNFGTNSPFAKTLRAYALNHGCKMYEVTLIDNPYEKVKTL